jgi:23S rRNA pseudouridine2604 synthase
MNEQRVSKLLAMRGICSRREADRYIEAGQVLVDGVVAELGMRASPEAKIELGDRARKRQGSKVTLLINKPVGYVSGQPEDGYRSVHELIDPRLSKRLSVAGRLDIDSRGLLVLTEDGVIVRQLIGDGDVEKEYLVRVTGTPRPDFLTLLQHGLELDGVPLQPAQVEWVNEHQLRFILKEGRKRQIRHMCEQVGLKVVGLKRVRIGRIRLGSLPEGKWRQLQRDEIF